MNQNHLAVELLDLSVFLILQFPLAVYFHHMLQLISMAIREVEFSNGGYNFENWVNGEVSKIGHHFSKGPSINDVGLFSRIYDPPLSPCRLRLLNRLM